MTLPPILVVDVETTTSDRLNAGLVEIGAIWLHPAYGRARGVSFEMKCRPRVGAAIEQGALQVNGCDWLEDETKPHESRACAAFADWIADSLHLEELRPDSVIMAGMNVGVFDWLILQRAFAAAGLVFPFSFRTYDLHALALQEAISRGVDDISSAGLKSADIQRFLKLPIEPRPHRALCGALIEHDAFWHLLNNAPPPCRELGEINARFFPVVAPAAAAAA